METVAVLDFETTGLSPTNGDRATEIAVVLVRDGEIVDRFQSLMNSGRWIPSDVERLTGITNDMVSSAPPVAKVMTEAAKFVGRLPLVAHNASFDRKFWASELERLSISGDSKFACTLLLARRLYPMAPNHRLTTLGSHLSLPSTGHAHRAMVDAEMAGRLWIRVCSDVARIHELRSVTHDLLTRVQKAPRDRVPAMLLAERGRSVSISVPAVQKPTMPVEVGQSALHAVPRRHAAVSAIAGSNHSIPSSADAGRVGPNALAHSGVASVDRIGARASHNHKDMGLRPAAKVAASSDEAKSHGFLARVLRALGLI